MRSRFRGLPLRSRSSEKVVWGGYQWRAIGASLSGKWTRILFGSNWAWQDVLVAGGNVAKHVKNKLVVPEAMVHIMAPATKQTKFVAYEAPALSVAILTVAQYEDLTQEQHPVTDWNRIILAIKAGRFDTEKEYEEIKLRASKKSVFSQAFTPRKKFKFATEGATAGMQAVDLEASSEIWTLLKPRRTVSEGAAHLLTEQEWETVCTYVQLLSMRLPELQEILFT
jgi:hypothetical protein